jgi:hypothetical protein
MIRPIKFAAVSVILMMSVSAWAQNATPSPDGSFVPFQQWMAAVLTSDTAALKALYSKDPPAQIRVKSVMHEASADTDFWLGLKVRNMKVEMVRLIIRPDRASLIFRADVLTGLPDGKRSV